MRRLRFGVFAATTGLLTAILGLVPVSGASDPSSSTVTIPKVATPPTVLATWTGTIQPGSHPANNCPLPDDPTQDTHDLVLQVPSGTYDKVLATITVKIVWDNAVNDEILTLVGPDGVEVGSSDGGDPQETVSMQNAPAGTYDVRACAFAAATPQAYTGTVTVETVSSGAGLPSADPQGLAFSASVPSEPQRDESEPLIESNIEGEIWTCGPTGSSNQADYAQVSTDGGDQFHLIGVPPRGQQAAGGGGDCAMAMSPVPNPTTNHSNYAYSGLNNLIEFSTATSPDGGRSLESSAVSESQPGLDRQWITFLDENRTLMNYNQTASPLVVPPGRATVVQRSTDRGLTYSLPVVGANNPLFPGQLRTLPAAFNPEGADAGPVGYFPWSTSSGAVQLSLSVDGGASWLNCRLLEDPRGVDGGFIVADHDTDGNIYVVYSDEADFHTYMSVLRASDLGACDDPASTQSKKLVPITKPVQVDRDKVRTSLFPWITVGAPGRVAVTFYGTESDGNPNTARFKASWDVYVNVSLNALRVNRTFSQVKATTHPFHYDSICLNGLACDTTDPGDRSLADFFAIDYSAVDGKIRVVYDQSAKKPDEAAGRVATPMVANQISGPSLGGGNVDPDHRPVVRAYSGDPVGDALSSYSNIGSEGAQVNEPAADFRIAKIEPEIDLATGQPLASGGGFTVTMKLDDLSDEALNSTLTNTAGQSLLWVFRFANGYTASAASAFWNPVQGFTFGYNDYTTTGAECGSASNLEKCQTYKGDQPIEGTVDQATGMIQLIVPRSKLRALSGPTGNTQRPAEVPATVGSRFYDATAFSFANQASAVQDVQSFLYPLDNSPAFDFLLPKTPPSVSVRDGNTYEGGPGAPGFAVRVSLSKAFDQPVTVHIATSPDTATAGDDYKSKSTRIRFDPGVRIIDVPIDIILDHKREPDETFFVDLSDPNGASIGDGHAVITIEGRAGTALHVI